MILYGRHAECDTLERLLADARRSGSGVLVVRGEAGVGKSALLDHAAELADGMLVLRASGVESEAELPFAALHQLLRPVLKLAGRLPAPQAAALRGALGLGDPGGDDRFLVSVAVLSLLAEAAEAGALVGLVDEAQWLDRSSAEALVFAARRLGAEGVALVFAARDGDPRGFPAPGLPELRLEGLGTEPAAALLAGRGATLPAEVVGRLVQRTGGNPLALLELPGTLEPDQLAGRAPLEDLLPLTERLERTFGERVRRLPGPTRTVLLVAAAEGTGNPAVVLRAAARLGVEADALDQAESAGLVQTGDGRLAFRHPLVRSAAYQTATFAARQAAHRALAEVLTGEDSADRRAWHLATATVGPDEAAAAGLERSADRARRRGGHAAAAAALERAAELTGDGGQRGRRLAAAATAAWLAGQAGRATALLDRAEPLAPDPGVAAGIAHLRGTIEASRGIAMQASAMLIAASELAAPVDPSQALQMLVEASEVASYAGDVTRPPSSAAGRQPCRPATRPASSSATCCRGWAGSPRATPPPASACCAGRWPWPACSTTRAGSSGRAWPRSSSGSPRAATRSTCGRWPWPGSRARSACCRRRSSTWPWSRWPPAATPPPPSTRPRGCAWPATPATTPAPAVTWPPWLTSPPFGANRTPAAPMPPRRWTVPAPAASGSPPPWRRSRWGCSTWGWAGRPRR